MRIIIWLTVVVGGLLLITPSAQRPTMVTDTISTLAPEPSITTTTSQPSVAEITTTAEATMRAVRIDPPETTIPFDPVSYCNGLPYEVLNPEPVRQCYVVVARTRGWDEATIQKWMQFAVDDVPMGESVGCPLVRGGAYGVQGFCEIGVQGRREDVGIGQLIGLWYNYPNGVLCRSEGICGADAILGSPFQSFNAYLAAIEHNGSQSWCYDARARQLHWSCKYTPRHWP